MEISAGGRITLSRPERRDRIRDALITNYVEAGRRHGVSGAAIRSTYFSELYWLIHRRRFDAIREKYGVTGQDWSIKRVKDDGRQLSLLQAFEEAWVLQDNPLR